MQHERGFAKGDSAHVRHLPGRFIGCPASLTQGVESGERYYMARCTAITRRGARAPGSIPEGLDTRLGARTRLNTVRGRALTRRSCRGLGIHHSHGAGLDGVPRLRTTL